MLGIWYINNPQNRHILVFLRTDSPRTLLPTHTLHLHFKFTANSTYFGPLLGYHTIMQPVSVDRWYKK